MAPTTPKKQNKLVIVDASALQAMISSKEDISVSGNAAIRQRIHQLAVASEDRKDKWYITYLRHACIDAHIHQEYLTPDKITFFRHLSFSSVCLGSVILPSSLQNKANYQKLKKKLKILKMLFYIIYMMRF